MNDREMKLAIAVGVLALMVVGFLAISSWSRRIAKLRGEQSALESQISGKKDQVRRGQRAQETLQRYRQRSLPADPEVARSEYKAWLLELAEKEIQLENPVVTPGSITRSGGAYWRLSLAVSGRGTLKQLTDLLYRFYGTDFAHQVRSLDIKPIEGSRDLEIHLGVDALVVDGAEAAETIAPKPSALVKEKSLDEFLGAILNRNLFAPANRSPQIASVSTLRGTVNESLSVSLKAEDPDELDKVTFSMGEGSATGASIDGSGKLRFRSNDVGTFEVTVVASDDGVPSRSSKKSISIVVFERPKVVVRPDRAPPKPKPYFEDGEFAFITAVTEVNGQRQLWLNIRTSGETLKLTKGEKFEVKRLKGVVSNIGEKQVEVTAGGERRRFGLGDNLAEGTTLAPPATAGGE